MSSSLSQFNLVPTSRWRFSIKRFTFDLVQCSARSCLFALLLAAAFTHSKFASTVLFLALSEPKLLAQSNLDRLECESSAVDDRRAFLGECTLFCQWQPAHQEVRNGQVEHRIAKELEPFIVRLTQRYGAGMR